MDTNSVAKRRHLFKCSDALKHLALLLALSSPVLAAPPVSLIAKIGEYVIEIFDEPCGEKVVAIMPAEFGPKFRRATVTSGTQVWAACWAAFDQYVYIVDETGDQGSTPADAYKRAVEI